MLNRGQYLSSSAAPRQNFEDIDGIIAKKVKEQRKKNHISQEALAEMVGVSLDAIKYLERGHGTKTSTIFKIASVMDIPVRILFPEQKTDIKTRIEDAYSLLNELAGTE